MIDALNLGDVLLRKYRIERVLGRGGMGVVLGVRHAALDELFAMKILHPRALEQPFAIERFFREARVTARLKGDHVIRVIDAGYLEEDVPYLMMEHLDGCDLATLLREQSPLPEDSIAYVLQTCEAISEAHAAGIVHRDIKPGNLFVCQRPDGTSSIKVLDFGVAKFQEDGAPNITGSGDVLGSPHYMSPEQLDPGAVIDERSDIWSLGVVLYRLLTGARPFGASTYEFLSQVRCVTPRPPSSLRPSLPAALDAVVARALSKSPARRFQKVEELAAALSEAVITGARGTCGHLSGAVPALQTPLSPSHTESEDTSLEVTRAVARRNNRTSALRACVAGAASGATVVAAMWAMWGMPVLGLRPLDGTLSAPQTGLSTDEARPVPPGWVSPRSVPEATDLSALRLPPASVVEEPSIADKPLPRAQLGSRKGPTQSLIRAVTNVAPTGAVNTGPRRPALGPSVSTPPPDPAPLSEDVLREIAADLPPPSAALGPARSTPGVDSESSPAARAATTDIDSITK